jgi:hypothetical protein
MASLQMEPPPPPPRRSASTSCDLHPDEAFTGFCAACLRERLAGLEASDVALALAAPGREIWGVKFPTRLCVFPSAAVGWRRNGSDKLTSFSQRQRISFL